MNFVSDIIGILGFCWLSNEQAEKQAKEYKGMKEFILGWTDKAEALVTGNIIWSSGSQLQEQIRAYQVSLYHVNVFKMLGMCCY